MNGTSEFSQCMAHNDSTIMVLIVVEHYCPLMSSAVQCVYVLSVFLLQ